MVHTGSPRLQGVLDRRLDGRCLCRRLLRGLNLGQLDLQDFAFAAFLVCVIENEVFAFV